MKLNTVAFALTTILLVACSNNKAANSANFTAAINGYYATNEGACVRTPHYPLDLPPGSRSPDYATSWALTQVGLLSFKEAPETVQGWFGPVRQDMYHYAPTPKAAPFWHPNDSTFCIGALHVANVENFTEPVASSEVGAEISQVKYTYYIDNVAPWSSDKRIQKYIPSIVWWLAGERKTIMTKRLALTNNGWEVWNNDGQQ